VRNGDPRPLSAGITRNSTFEADSGALREFVEQLQSRVGELQELGYSQRTVGEILGVDKMAINRALSVSNDTDASKEPSETKASGASPVSNDTNTEETIPTLAELQAEALKAVKAQLTQDLEAAESARQAGKATG